MTKYNKKNFKSLEDAKSFFRDEAWEYFKKMNNLPITTDRLGFELYTKNEALKELWGAFRHVYTSAAFTKTYGSTTAKIAGDINEIMQFGSIKSPPFITEYKPGNEPRDRRMDLKNNAAGRKIASQNNGTNLIDEVYYNLKNNPEIIINQNTENDEQFTDIPIMNLIWNGADTAYYKINQNPQSKSKKTNTALNKENPISDYDDMFLKGQIEYNNTTSLREKLIRAKEQKLARYTQRLAESPEKIKEQEQKHISLEELKAPQNNKIQKVHDMIQNAHKKNNSNLTTSGGDVYVKEYTRADGTKVRSYYRKR